MALLPYSFARKAPARSDPQRLVDIRIADMTWRDTRWWDARVQSRIASIKGRADRTWVWSAMLPMLLLHQLSKRRRCRPLVVWGRADNDRFMRVAMSFVIERFPHLNSGLQGLESHFLWFVSAAPTEVLDTLGMTDPPSVGRIVIDASMVLSWNADLSGRIGLHAAPAGGDKLLHFYENTCRLRRLSAGEKLPSGVRRRNDGRFFIADDVVAQSLLEEGNVWRTENAGRA